MAVDLPPLPDGLAAERTILSALRRDPTRGGTMMAELRPDAYHRLRRMLPDQGPCAFCNHRWGAKHRIVDAILERVRAGEPIAAVADDYELDAGLFAETIGDGDD